MAVVRLGRWPVDLEEVEILVGADELVVPSPSASLLEAAFLTIPVLFAKRLVETARELAAGLRRLGRGLAVLAVPGLGTLGDLSSSGATATAAAAVGLFAARPGRQSIIPRGFLGRSRNIVPILVLIGRLFGWVAHVPERIALKSIGLWGIRWWWKDVSDGRIRERRFDTI